MGSKAGSASKVKLNSFDDLFGGAENIAGEQIIHAKLADLHTFKGHPFRVLDDEKMEETTESIGKYGVLVPGIVRPRTEGGYETQADSIMDRIIHNAYEIPTNETNLRKMYDSKKLKKLVDKIES